MTVCVPLCMCARAIVCAWYRWTHACCVCVCVCVCARACAHSRVCVVVCVSVCGSGVKCMCMIGVRNKHVSRRPCNQIEYEQNEHVDGMNT